VLVGNKVYDVDPEHAAEVFKDVDNLVLISAKKRENIAQLKDALYNKVAHGAIKQEGTIITNTRHYSALQEVEQSLADIRGGMDNNIPGDLISLDIRRCLHYLGDITGEVTTEDKLDYIFSKFCIGK
jgi:tRNA modification GTPase